MFLITITKNGVAQNFQSEKIEEFNLHSLKVTILTDRFLSDFFNQATGFSVIESPLIFTPDYRNIIFSQISYDNKNDSLQISKSTISGRPLYYHLNSAGEFFCSTHISLLKTAGVPIEENIDVLPEFFVYRFVIPPNTLYKNIFQLHNGDQLHIQIKNNKAYISNLVHFTPPEPIQQNDFSSIINHTLTLLNKSIQLLEFENKKTTVLLSGGLDSSILFKICQNNFQTDTTFSTGFPFENPDNNIEKEYSLSAAKLFHTKHHFIETTFEEYLDGFLEAISKAEQPVHHLQSVPLYLLFKKIPQEKNIILSGLGADDLFGTSTQYNLYRIKHNLLLKLLTKYQRVFFIKYFIEKNKHYKIAVNDYTQASFPITDTDNNLIWSLGTHGDIRWTTDHFNVTKKDIIKNRYEIMKKYFDRQIYDIISILLFLGSASATQVIWSKLGEAEKKILYYPFTNNELVNYIFSVPWNVKLNEPKNILRHIAHQLKIPKEIIYRPKSAFGVNPELWGQKDCIFEPLIPMAKKIIDEKEIRHMQSTELHKAMTYWNMLNYSIWKRICINNEPLEVLKEELR